MDSAGVYAQISSLGTSTVYCKTAYNNESIYTGTWSFDFDGTTYCTRVFFSDFHTSNSSFGALFPYSIISDSFLSGGKISFALTKYATKPIFFISTDGSKGILAVAVSAATDYYALQGFTFTLQTPSEAYDLYTNQGNPTEASGFTDITFKYMSITPPTWTLGTSFNT